MLLGTPSRPQGGKGEPSGWGDGGGVVIPAHICIVRPGRASPPWHGTRKCPVDTFDVVETKAAPPTTAATPGSGNWPPVSLGFFVMVSMWRFKRASWVGEMLIQTLSNKWGDHKFTNLMAILILCSFYTCLSPVTWWIFQQETTATPSPAAAVAVTREGAILSLIPMEPSRTCWTRL